MDPELCPFTRPRVLAPFWAWAWRWKITLQHYHAQKKNVHPLVSSKRCHSLRGVRVRLFLPCWASKSSKVKPSPTETKTLRVSQAVPTPELVADGKFHNKRSRRLNVRRSCTRPLDACCTRLPTYTHAGRFVLVQPGSYRASSQRAARPTYSVPGELPRARTERFHGFPCYLNTPDKAVRWMFRRLQRKSNMASRVADVKLVSSSFDRHC